MGPENDGFLKSAYLNSILLALSPTRGVQKRSQEFNNFCHCIIPHGVSLSAFQPANDVALEVGLFFVL
jgi:hypothetical protein